MSLFEDDTKNFSDSIISLQFTLDNIYKWLKTRKLDLNPIKFTILTIKKSKSFNPIDLLMYETKIPTVKFLKDIYILKIKME